MQICCSPCCALSQSHLCLTSVLGWAVLVKEEHSASIPALLMSPSLPPSSEQLQEVMTTAWQFASASPSGNDHHAMHVPQKRCSCDGEGSKFFVLERSH